MSAVKEHSEVPDRVYRVVLQLGANEVIPRWFRSLVREWLDDRSAKEAERAIRTESGSTIRGQKRRISVRIATQRPAEEVEATFSDSPMVVQWQRLAATEELQAQLARRNAAIGKGLRTLRQEQKISRNECAAYLGISRQRMAAIEHGDTGITVPELEALTAYLNVPQPAKGSGQDIQIPVLQPSTDRSPQ